MLRYETIPHTADLSIRVFGKTLEELFTNAAFAMFDVMTRGGSGPNRMLTVSVAAGTVEDLLVDYLAVLLAVAETERVAVRTLSVKIPKPGEVTADVTGFDLDTVTVCGPLIKAVTYHRLSVTGDDQGWIATIVFDV
jgi:SHS2 domain-containing protein